MSLIYKYIHSRGIVELTQFLICRNCRTVFEVPSRAVYIDKIKCSVNSLIMYYIKNDMDIKSAYAFYDYILPKCCNNPIRKWAYGYNGFPEYHQHMLEGECLNYIKQNNLKLIDLDKEYPELLQKLRVVLCL